MTSLRAAAALYEHAAGSSSKIGSRNFSAAYGVQVEDRFHPEYDAEASGGPHVAL